MSEKIFVTGGTGFIGRVLVQSLIAKGYSVVVLTRDPVGGRAKIGPGAEFFAVDRPDSELSQVLSTCSGVIHLAGDDILGRWTQAKREKLRSSRVDLTERLVRCLEAASPRPKVMVAGSAVGFYGATGQTQVDEDSPAGEGFLPELCQDWEAAQRGVEELGMRLVQIRTGVVLDTEGKALFLMLPAFRMGVAGPLSTGSHFMPWIFLEDMVRLLVTALEDPSYQGVYNGVAPEEATNWQYTKALSRAVGMPNFIPVPGFVLKLLLGEVSSLLLDSQRVHPKRLLEAGFEFACPTLEKGFERVFAPEAEVEFTTDFEVPDELAGSPPSHRLRSSEVLPVSPEEAYAYFENPRNLRSVLPSWLSFSPLAPPPEKIFEGLELKAKTGFGPVASTWTTTIEKVEPGARFVDSGKSLGISLWWHEHRFEDLGDGRTRVTDTIYLRPAFSVLGRLGLWAVGKNILKGMFATRRRAIERIFARPKAPAAKAA